MKNVSASFICSCAFSSGSVDVPTACESNEIFKKTFLPKELWDEEREVLRANIRKPEGFKLYGFDIDPEAVRLTRDNAVKAGVGEYIEVKQRDVADFTYPEGCTVVLCNPPYGERMLDEEQAHELYKVMGKRLLPTGNRRLFVITPDGEFEELFGKKADKNRKLYNGMLMCRLYSYFKATPHN